jgi:hypothetical protein
LFGTVRRGAGRLTAMFDDRGGDYGSPAAVNAGLVISTAFATAFATSTHACSASFLRSNTSERTGCARSLRMLKR